MREKSSINTPYYTFKIVNRDSYDEYIFAPTNNSTSNYYDSFTISIGASTSATFSVVIDAVAGQYDYFAYEMNTEYDLDLNNSLGVVESGILLINGTYSSLSTITSFTQSNDDLVKVFTGL